MPSKKMYTYTVKGDQDPNDGVKMYDILDNLGLEFFRLNPGAVALDAWRACACYVTQR